MQYKSMKHYDKFTTKMYEKKSSLGTDTNKLRETTAFSF